MLSEALLKFLESNSRVALLVTGGLFFFLSSVKHKNLPRVLQKCIILPSELKSKFTSVVNFNIKRGSSAYQN